MPSSQKPSLRLFIGSPLPDDAKASLMPLADQRQMLERQGGYRFSWVKPQNLHLTWLFIGSVAPEQADGIIQTIQTELVFPIRILVRLTRLAFWPNGRRPKLLVWEGESNPGLEKVSRKIKAAFPQYAEDRPFRPHITLARLKPQEGERKANLAIPPALMPAAYSWHVSEGCLYQSDLQPSGAVYTPLLSWRMHSVKTPD